MAENDTKTGKPVRGANGGAPRQERERASFITMQVLRKSGRYARLMDGARPFQAMLAKDLIGN